MKRTSSEISMCRHDAQLHFSRQTGQAFRKSSADISGYLLLETKTDEDSRMQVKVILAKNDSVGDCLI